MTNKKNDTHDGLHEMRTGVDDLSRLGELLSWKGATTVKAWLNTSDGEISECNRIRGSDGTLFRPKLQTDTVLQTFITDLCR